MQIDLDPIRDYRVVKYKRWREPIILWRNVPAFLVFVALIVLFAWVRETGLLAQWLRSW